MKNTIKERQFCADEKIVSHDIPQTNQAATRKSESVRWLKKAQQWIARWRERRATRRLLRALSDNQLRDIGLTRKDVHEEYERKVWPHWPK